MHPVKSQLSCGLTTLSVGVFASPSWANQKLAIVVGGIKYDHDNLKPLRFAVGDASELNRVLQSRSGFQVMVLSNESALRPTKAKSQQQVTAMLEKCQRGDTYFYPRRWPANSRSIRRQSRSATIGRISSSQIIREEISNNCVILEDNTANYRERNPWRDC